MNFLIPSANIPIPKNAIFIPLYDRPVFPGTLVPFFIKNKNELKQLEETVEKNSGYIALSFVKTIEKNLTENLSTQNNSPQTISTNKLQLQDIHTVGVLGKVLRIVANPNPSPNPNSEQKNEIIAQIIISTITRVNITKLINNKPLATAGISSMASDIPISEKEQNAYAVAMFSKVKELISLNSLFAEEMKMALSTNAQEISMRTIYLIASLLSSTTPKEMQKLLEANKIRSRFGIVLEQLQQEIEISRIKEKINKKIEGDVSKQQHEFFLREQLKAIKKELGMEEDGKTTTIRKLREAKQKLHMTEAAEKVFAEEIAKLEIQDPRSQEYTVVHNYLEWLVALPWGKETKENKNLAAAEKILNKDHYGMEKVKERLLTLVAMRILRNSSSGQVITLVGPPGVGKTSIGKSIAKALGRQFYRFSLGGMRDEAEVRGHRRTYVGAMPGKFIQAMKYVSTSNPVIMLDEIDKISSTYQGDPSNALLEVLDKEQNNAFTDLYLDVPFDFSKIIFITTANQLDTIPRPLLDRMDVVELNGYLPEEKKHIAKKYFIPRLLKETGLGDKKAIFPNNTINTIINSYARESGVRSLERHLRTILAKIALQVVRNEKKLPITIAEKDVVTFLGNPKFTEDEAFASPPAGIVGGLAWTAMGGATFNIESLLAGKGSGLKLTGSLGKVMEESAQLAFSYVKSLLATSNQKTKDAFLASTVHLHVPSGATPKDGPSAGIAMALALYSLAVQKPIRSQLTMTGELTLSGQVFPIGGLKEKIIAGKRANKKEIIVPENNRRDVEDFSAQITKGIKFYFVKTFKDVLNIALKTKIL